MSSNGTITKLTTATVATGTDVTQPTLDLLNALGHGNGSGAAEEFTIVPGFPGLYRAKNFGDPADPDETKIAAAVVACKAAGGWGVLVDDDMIPYDATAAGLDTAVHMFRAGGSLSRDEYDAAAYGVDVSTLDNADELAAVSVAAQAGTSHKIVLPAGTIRHAKPWVLGPTTGQLTIVGAHLGTNLSSGYTRLSATHAGGATILACGSLTVAGLGASLLTGSGQSWTPSELSEGWALRDLSTCDLNGLTAFTAEVFWKGTDTSVCWLSSRGRWLTADAATSAFGLLAASGKANASINTTGSGTVSLADGTAINNNAVHHIALSWDGSTARLCVDGVVVDSAAATGTLVQADQEEVSLGPYWEFVPHGTYVIGSGTGTVDSPRLSNSARYTGNFTAPTAQFSSDANTLALINFDDSIGNAIKVYTKNGVAWLDQRSRNAAGEGGRGLHIEGVDIISGSAGRATGLVIGNGSYNWSVEGMSVWNCRTGIIAPLGNAYAHSLRRIYINNSSYGRYGIALGTFAAVANWEGLWLQGNKIQALSMGLLVINEMYCESSSALVVQMLLRNSGNNSAPTVLNGVNFSTEAGVGTAYRGAMAFGGLGSVYTNGVVAHGCSFTSGNSAPHLIAGYVDAAEFHACNFNSAAGQTEIMAAHGTFTRPVVFSTCHQHNTFLPWSDTAGTATVAHMGRSAATPAAGAVTVNFSLASNYSVDQLAANLTSQTWQSAGDGQEVRVRYRQASSGGPYTAADPGNVIGWSAIDSTAGNYSEWRGYFDQALNKFVGSMTTGIA